MLMICWIICYNIISYEKPKMLKKEKMIKANNKNYIDIELKDLDVQYHGNQMPSTLEYKNINSIEEIMNDYNKQNNNNNLIHELTLVLGEPEVCEVAWCLGIRGINFLFKNFNIFFYFLWSFSFH